MAFSLCSVPGCIAVFKLQYYRVSAPTELLVADRGAITAASTAQPFAYTGAPAYEQAVWSSAYRWLQGGVAPADAPAASPAELLQIIDSSGDEVQRMGAGYQLGEHVAAAAAADDDATADSTLAAMRQLLEQANTPVDPTSLPGGAEPRGQHGCKESALRALQYGLMNGGEAAVPTLLNIIETADLSNAPGSEQPHFLVSSALLLCSFRIALV
jgi:hypothetical protein